MFITTARHERLMKAAKKPLLTEIANTALLLAGAREDCNGLTRENHNLQADLSAVRIELETAQQERDDALVELRAIKAGRGRSNANLRRGTPPKVSEPIATH